KGRIAGTRRTSDTRSQSRPRAESPPFPTGSEDCAGCQTRRAANRREPVGTTKQEMRVNRSWYFSLPPGTLPQSSTGADKRHLNQMFREKPDLHFVRADHIAHQQVIRPIITRFDGLPGHRSGLKENDLVRME